MRERVLATLDVDGDQFELVSPKSVSKEDACLLFSPATKAPPEFLRAAEPGSTVLFLGVAEIGVPGRLWGRDASRCGLGDDPFGRVGGIRGRSSAVRRRRRGRVWGMAPPPGRSTMWVDSRVGGWFSRVSGCW